MGKGPIPGINALAPVYNQDLDKNQIKRLLNYRDFKVYGANGIGLITKKSIDRVFASSNKIDGVHVINKTIPTHVETVKIADVSVVEETEVPVTYEHLPEIESADKVVDGEKVCEPVVDESMVVDNVEETKMTNRNNYNKNKNKKKNHYKS